MKFMLDTNICIYVINKKPAAFLHKFESFQVGDLAISSVTLAELEYGVAKSQNKTKNKEALEQFIIPMDIVAFDDLAAEKYGVIRSELEKNGNIIGALDLMIAAHAISLNLTLITNNLKEFKRVKSLKLDNWSVFSN